MDINVSPIYNVSDGQTLTSVMYKVKQQAKSRVTTRACP